MPDAAAPAAPVAPASTEPIVPPTSLRGREDRPDRPAAEAVDAAGRGARTTATERQSALDWFLSPDEDESATKDIEINVGTDRREKWITWTIRPVDADELRRIGRTTNARRGKEDEASELAQLRVIVAGTVDPDLSAAAKQTGIADPAMALRMRFARKPGLTGQIASEIMALSGFDDEDVREAAAAGN